MILSFLPVDDGALTAVFEKGKMFVALLDKNLERISIVELHGKWETTEDLYAKWIGKTKSGKYLLKAGNSLYQCGIDGGDLDGSTISSNVADAAINPSEEKSNWEYAYITRGETSSLVFFVNAGGSEQLAARLPTGDVEELHAFEKNVAVLTYSESIRQVYIQMINSSGISGAFWVETPGNLFKLFKIDEKFTSLYLRSEEGQYNFFLDTYTSIPGNFTRTVSEVPGEFIEPMGIELVEGLILLIFRNGLVTFDNAGEIMSADFFPVGEYLGERPKADFTGKHLILSGKSGSLVFEMKEHTLWFVNRFIRNRGLYLFPVLLIIALLVFIQLYRHQKRLLREILELPSSGLVLIIDKNGRLKNANEPARSMLGISGGVPMGRLVRYYFAEKYLEPFKNLIDTALTSRDMIRQRINILQGSDLKEWYCTIVPLKNITGNFRGLVVTAIDITEQLERRRLSNWAQLAHDMQTNLSTIRLNAEQLDSIGNGENKTRKKKIIHQVGLLIQRVRDIVTVGRSDELDLSLVNSAELCRAVSEEFDETMFPNIRFEHDFQSFNILCDKPKLSRALRNAVENGIKAIGNKEGKIILRCRKDARYSYISIRDSGIGMDASTKQKMLKPYFTTSRKHGGSGIGTMIIQQVVELHGGDLSIESEPGKGTEITFIIPNRRITAGRNIKEAEI